MIQADPSIPYIIYARKSSESEDRQVASISSQVDELKRLAKERNLKVVDILTEEKSAKAPGRPIFGQLLADISNGKAKGILCWKLDRLARNPVDGGSITWMLQNSVIQKIQTYQRAYSPMDNVLFMAVEFGMANQFILDLSVNTKRGMRAKVQDGWFPHKPPIGYLSNKHKLPEHPPIYKDPTRFNLVRKLWDMLLEKKYPVEDFYQIAIDIGLRTARGKPYPLSAFHLLFRNPFYYGSFNWKSELFPGKHEPMLTKTEFDVVQKLLDTRSVTRAKSHLLAFTGLIRCGECGASITAEHKKKHQKNGNTHQYTYYRCTKRIKKDCSQMPIRSDRLEAQIQDIVSLIQIPASFHQWAIKTLKEERLKETADRDGINQAQRKCLEDCTRKLDALFDMRVNGEITPEEYQAKKEVLSQEKAKYTKLLEEAAYRQEAWLARAEALFDFAEKAKEKFENGTFEVKRDTIAKLGSNLSLLNGTLEAPLEEGLYLFPDTAREVRDFHNRLEPLKSKAPQEVMEGFYSKNEKWGG
ncbi:MAG: recombinase family protein [Candidatus Omnitrophica bacterium]|nr:recombinase family protein [Candidatus Omnitrophota bacterium]